jgi:hypothetical protein
VFHESLAVMFLEEILLEVMTEMLPVVHDAEQENIADDI